MGGDGSLKEMLFNSSFVREYKALRTLGLKPLEYLILNEILSYNLQDLEYTGSYGYFVSEFNVAHTTVLRALNNLIDKGYISKTLSSGGKASVYKVNESKLKTIFSNSSETLELNDTNSSETLGEQYQNARVNPSETLRNKNIIYKNIYKNNLYGQTDVRPTGSNKNKNEQTLKSITDMFNKFWEAYPKKVKKSVALKKWKTLKPSEKLFKDIMRALKIQKETYDWQKENGRFIPHPTTWLNQRRWEDITEAEKKEVQEVRYILPTPKPLIDELGGE